MKVRVYVVSDVPCSITYYHVLDVIFPAPLNIYSSSLNPYTGVLGTDPEFTLNNVYFSYFEIAGNFSNGRLIGVKNVQKSNPDDELPPDAIVYESFSNITNLDEPPYREVYQHVTFDYTFSSSAIFYSDYPTGIK